MPRTTSLIVAALLALLAATSTATAASRDRCAPHEGERRLDRSARIAALLATKHSRHGLASRLLACDRRTGKRTLLGQAGGYDYGEEPRIDTARVTGELVAWVTTFRDRYGDGWATVRVADRAKHTTQQLAVNPGHFTAWDFGPHDEVAWIADHHVHLWHPSPSPIGDTRVLDGGVQLSRVAIAGSTVRWRHGSGERSAPLTLPPTRCPTSQRGTPEVDLPEIGGICWRATGLVTPIAPWVDSPFDIDGPYVALAAHDAVMRYDARDGTTLTVPAPGPSSALVAPNGGLAWTEYTEPNHREIWVHDGTGTHLIGATTSEAPVRDDTTIWWSLTDSYTLTAPCAPLRCAAPAAGTP
jgi:hypothetical protein